MTTLTEEQGKALALTYHKAFTAGFAANNHAETMKDIYASSVEFDWSDGFKGTKTPEEIFERMATTWGLMVSDIVWDISTMVVDTTNGKVLMGGNNVINIDGKLGKAHIVHAPFVQTIGVDENGKVNSVVGVWNNAEPSMLEALGKVSEALKAGA